MENVNYSYQPLGILIQTLRILCDEKQNGRLSILTDTKKFANILLVAGNIIEISFASNGGRQALSLLSNVKECRFHFSKGKQKKSTKVANLPTNNEILQQLGQNCMLAKTTRQNVLVIDDSKFIRKVVKKSLSCKYDVLEASNGLEAIASLAHIKPDLILLDVVMPDLSGYEVLNVIKNNSIYADVPVFMLTSRDSLMDKVRGKMSQSDQYITKPFSEEGLLSQVDTQLNNLPLQIPA